jgi:hypothetical protein
MASEPTSEPTPVDPANLMDRTERWFLGVYLAAVALLLIYLFGKLWPSELGNGERANQPIEFLFGWVEVLTSAETRMLVLVLCAGALGAMVHAVQSFTDFHGNQCLARSWIPWYVLRPFIGALLALVFYPLLRSGLVAGALQESGGQTATGVAGLVGTAALVGMFSELATVKLKDIFTTIFTPRDTPKRADPLQPASTSVPKPEVSELKPDKLSVGAASPKVTVVGRNFAKEAKVLVDDKERPTIYVSSEELTLQLENQDTSAKIDLKIAVANPAKAGGTSDPKTLPVT